MAASLWGHGQALAFHVAWCQTQSRIIAWCVRLGPVRIVQGSVGSRQVPHQVTRHGLWVSIGPERLPLGSRRLSIRTLIGHNRTPKQIKRLPHLGAWLIYQLVRDTPAFPQTLRACFETCWAPIRHPPALADLFFKTSLVWEYLNSYRRRQRPM